MRDQPAGPSELSLDETQRLVHELRVHQIELEMQNQELRRAQGELEASRDRFVDLYDLAPVGYLTTSETGLILEANLTAATMLRAERGSLLKQPLSRFIIQEDQHVYYDHRQQLFETQTLQVYEMRMVRADGTWFHAHVEAVVAHTGTKGAPVCRATFTDVSERKRAEAMLQAYSERLEEMVRERTQELREAQGQLIRQEKLALLGQLSGSIGHELRAPLAVIANATYFLKNPVPDIDVVDGELLDLISTEVYNMKQIIADLLDYARTGFIERTPVAARALVDQVLAAHPPPAEVHVRTEMSAGLPSVYVDGQQVTLALANLVLNAYQAMPEGGRLTISAHMRQDQVFFSIADTGSGISEENMTRLFKPLFTTKPRGIGLGLVTAKNLIEANGGSIAVESQERHGSTFTVGLPWGREEGSGQ